MSLASTITEALNEFSATMLPPNAGAFHVHQMQMAFLLGAQEGAVLCIRAIPHGADALIALNNSIGQATLALIGEQIAKPH